jgi:hypothetical protein
VLRVRHRKQEVDGLCLLREMMEEGKRESLVRANRDRWALLHKRQAPSALYNMLL